MVLTKVICQQYVLKLKKLSKMENLYDIWGRRNPSWEIKYQESIIDVFCDYGRGSSRLQGDRGKIFGAGYEMFIVAFFIGLYNDKRKPLVKDTSKIKTFGQPIQFWGNLEGRFGRTSYGKIRNYIFAALVAKTDIDFVALDKGDITVRKVVDDLMTTMEEYANFGFDFITEKMEEDPDCFFKETAFLRVFLKFINPKTLQSADEGIDDDMPDDLDSWENDSQIKTGTNEMNDISSQQAQDDFLEEISVPHARKRWTMKECSELKSFFKQGMTIEQLASFFSKSEESVRSELERQGLI